MNQSIRPNIGNLPILDEQFDDSKNQQRKDIHRHPKPLPMGRSMWLLFHWNHFLPLSIHSSDPRERVEHDCWNNQRHKDQNHSLQRFHEDYSACHVSILDNPFPRQYSSSYSIQREEIFSPLDVYSTVNNRDCPEHQQTVLNIVSNKLTSATNVWCRSTFISPLDCLHFRYQRRSVHHYWQTDSTEQRDWPRSLLSHWHLNYAKWEFDHCHSVS